MAQPFPTTARGRATRARITRAAVDVIAEHGASALSLDLVMQRAGASKGQLYHYFEGRDDLIHAAVATTIEDVAALQSDIMRNLDTWDGIRAWFDCLVDLQATRDGRGGCPMASLAAHLVETDEHARLQLLTGFERWEGMLAQGLASMLEQGRVVDGVDPARLATAAMAAVQGGLVLTQVRRDPDQLRIALDASWSYLRSFAAGE